MKKTMTALATLLTAGTVMIGNASAQISAFNYASADFGLSGSAFSIIYNVLIPMTSLLLDFTLITAILRSIR